MTTTKTEQNSVRGSKSEAELAVVVLKLIFFFRMRVIYNNWSAMNSILIRRV